VTSDVIIAGAGVAGTAVAAALAEFGYSVLIVEPGMNRPKRLAGELIHPPGVEDLRELGLLACLEQSGVTPVQGFAVFAGDCAAKPAADSFVSAATGAYLLPYAATTGRRNQGLAIEHEILSEALLGAVTKFSHVTVWKDAHVMVTDLSQAEVATVTVMKAGRECQLCTRLLVAADGRHSPLRRMGGIGHKQVHISNMVGYSLRNSCLPHPGFGHLFLRGPAPAVAYEVGPGTTRIMFDLPQQLNGAATPAEYMRRYLDALPQPLRSEVQHVMETQSPLMSNNSCIIPDAVIRGRLVCAGDAGGCCHPLTATGLSVCMRDAIRLRQALRETAGDIPGALRRYAKRRKGPQRTRLAGTELLYDVFKAERPEMHLLREGLLRYWRQSAHGRAATMSLLSTQEERRSVLIREYLLMCRYALPELIHGRDDEGPRSRDSRNQAVLGLSRAVLKFLGETCQR